MGMTHGCSVRAGSSAGQDGMAVCLGLHSSLRGICWGCKDFFAPLSGTQPGMAERTEDWLIVLSGGCTVDGLFTQQLASLKLRIPRVCLKRPRQKLQDFL